MSLSINEVNNLFANSFLPVMNVELQHMFKAADAVLMQLGIEAKTNKEQNRYFEAVQGLRIEKRQLIQSFSKGFLDSIQQQEDQRDTEHVLALRQLSTINLDLWRANTSLAAAHFDLDSRLASIDPVLKNPLNPEHVVTSYLHALATIKVDIHSKLLMMRLFESQLYGKLERYVRTANDVLIDCDILPELETQPSDMEASINAIISETLGQEVGIQAHGFVLLLEEGLLELQANDIEHGDELLSVEQIASDSLQIKVRDLIAELNHHNLLPTEIDEAMVLHTEKVQLVAKLFQYMMDNESLPREAKALLVHLQLPYARVALADADMLQRSSHPARALLDCICEVLADWQPKKEDLADDDVFKMLQSTVRYFLEIERVSSINYQEYLFKFLAYAEGRRQKSLLVSNRLIDTQVGIDIADTIRETVNNLLDKKMSSRKIPNAVKRLLSEGWSHVLYVTALQKGLAAKEWQQAVEVVDDVIISVCTPEIYPSRSDFMQRLSVLLKKIRMGLTAIDISATLINQMFVDLEQEHKRAVAVIKGDFADLENIAHLRPKTIQDLAFADDQARNAEEPPFSLRTGVPFSKEQWQVLASEAVEVVKLNAKHIFSDETLSIMEKLVPGMFLLWIKEGKEIRCRVAAHIKHAKRFIITERSGAKIGDLTEYEMSEKIDSGEIKVMISEQMFNRALESVIGGMRDRR